VQPQPVSVSGLLAHVLEEPTPAAHGAGIRNFSHSRSVWRRPRKKKAADPGAQGACPGCQRELQRRPWMLHLLRCCSHRSNCWRGRQRSGGHRNWQRAMSTGCMHRNLPTLYHGELCIQQLLILRTDQGVTTACQVDNGFAVSRPGSRGRRRGIKTWRVLSHLGLCICICMTVAGGSQVSSSLLHL